MNAWTDRKELIQYEKFSLVGMGIWASEAWQPLTRYSTSTTGEPSASQSDRMRLANLCCSSIDRLLTTWQLLNGNSKSIDNVSGKGHEPGPEAKLAPFYKDEKYNLYDSNGVKEWTDLDYQYPNTSLPPRVMVLVARTSDSEPMKHIDYQIRRTVNMELNRSRRAVFYSPELDGKGNDYILNVVNDRCERDSLLLYWHVLTEYIATLATVTHTACTSILGPFQELS